MEAAIPVTVLAAGFEWLIPVAFFAVFIAIGITAAVGAYYYEKRRTEAWGRVARSLGFTVLPCADGTLGHARQVFRLFK